MVLLMEFGEEQYKYIGWARNNMDLVFKMLMFILLAWMWVAIIAMWIKLFSEDF